MDTRIIIESPFDGNERSRSENLKFARACMADSLERGEAPVVFHKLYPRAAGGPLPETAEGRQRGMDAAQNWFDVAEKLVVYSDLGVTSGMKKAIAKASSSQRATVEFRTLKESDFKPDWYTGPQSLDNPNQ